jgi:glycosyltransferase involved in cell wall biosynthesis
MPFQEPPSGGLGRCIASTAISLFFSPIRRQRANLKIMTPMISVVIPTFNRAALVVKAIESVFAQTYKDYEVIVVDDGSVDNTREILKPYRERLQYIYQENRGAAAAQNTGIRMARGKWISILGSDDLWLPAKLERQIEAVTNLGNEFGACFTDCIFFGNSNLVKSVFEEAGLRSNLKFAPLENQIRHILGEHFLIWPQSLLVLRSLLQELNGFDEAMSHEEDIDLIFRLGLITHYCFVSSPLVKIDRSPSRSRLTGDYSTRIEEIYGYNEYRFRKWLALPDGVDAETRRAIQDRLRTLYYAWISAKLYKLSFAGALEKMSLIGRMGDNYHTILGTLLARAAKKLFRTFRGQSA